MLGGQVYRFLLHCCLPACSCQLLPVLWHPSSSLASSSSALPAPSAAQSCLCRLMRCWCNFGTQILCWQLYPSSRVLAHYHHCCWPGPLTGAAAHPAAAGFPWGFSLLGLGMEDSSVANTVKQANSVRKIFLTDWVGAPFTAAAKREVEKQSLFSSSSASTHGTVVGALQWE